MILDIEKIRADVDELKSYFKEEGQGLITKRLLKYFKVLSFSNPFSRLDFEDVRTNGRLPFKEICPIARLEILDSKKMDVWFYNTGII